MKHKHSHLPPASSRPGTRIIFGLAGIMILWFGIATITAGKLHYPNWWGGAVFAPFAIIVGTIMVIAAIRGKPFRSWRGVNPAAQRRKRIEPGA
jgi:membrane protein implicated in regulation of membrane protease activity